MLRAKLAAAPLLSRSTVGLQPGSPTAGLGTDLSPPSPSSPLAAGPGCAGIPFPSSARGWSRAHRVPVAVPRARASSRSRFGLSRVPQAALAPEVQAGVGGRDAGSPGSPLPAPRPRGPRKPSAPAAPSRERGSSCPGPAVAASLLSCLFITLRRSRPPPSPPAGHGREEPGTVSVPRSRAGAWGALPGRDPGGGTAPAGAGPVHEAPALHDRCP